MSSWAGARALVVDDDAALRDYVRTLLERRGIAVDQAVDGLEAEAKLRGAGYQLLFLDLDLPNFSGRFVLDVLKRAKVGRPNWVVVMSGAPNIDKQLGDDWTRLGIHDFLPKPFNAHDIETLLGKILVQLGEAGQNLVREVLLVGSGSWLEAVGSAVRKGGGKVAMSSAEGAMAALDRAPGVLVLGPPLADGEIVRICVSIPEARRATTEILVAADRSALGLRADLLTLGARQTVQLPEGLAWLTDEVTRLAGSKPPPRRTPCHQTVLLRAANGVYPGMTVELFEGGLSAIFTMVEPPVPPMVVEFELPGAVGMIEASVTLAWSQPSPGGGVQIGLQFTQVSDRDLERIRNFVVVRDAAS